MTEKENVRTAPAEAAEAASATAFAGDRAAEAIAPEPVDASAPEAAPRPRGTRRPQTVEDLPVAEPACEGSSEASSETSPAPVPDAETAPEPASGTAFEATSESAPEASPAAPAEPAAPAAPSAAESPGTPEASQAADADERSEALTSSEPSAPAEELKKREKPEEPEEPEESEASEETSEPPPLEAAPPPVRRASPAPLLALTGSIALAFGVLLFAGLVRADWAPLPRIALFGLAALAALFAALVTGPLARAPKRTPSDIAAAAFGILLTLLLAVIGEAWPMGEGPAALLSAAALVLTPWLLVLHRPGFISVWFATALGGLLLTGAAETATAAAGLPGPTELLSTSLPAMLLASLPVIAGGVALRLLRDRPAAKPLRATLILPALSTAALCGGLPAAAVALDSGAGLLPVIPAGLLALALLAALLSRAPELVTVLLLGAAALADGLLSRGLELLGVGSGASQAYALLLLNGLTLLAASALASRLKRRPSGDAREGTAPADSEGERSLAERLASALPGVVCGALGGMSLVLLVITALEFTPMPPVAAGGLLWLAGLASASSAASRRSRSGILPTLALLLSAAGWVILAPGEALAIPGVPAALLGLALALPAAWLLGSRIALLTALLSPLVLTEGLPEGLAPAFLTGSWHACLAALSSLVLALAAFSPAESPLRERLLAWLPAPLLALWAAPLAPELMPGLPPAVLPPPGAPLEAVFTTLQSLPPFGVACAAFALLGALSGLAGAARSGACRNGQATAAALGILAAGLALGDAALVLALSAAALALTGRRASGLPALAACLILADCALSLTALGTGAPLRALPLPAVLAGAALLVAALACRLLRGRAGSGGSSAASEASVTKGLLLARRAVAALLALATLGLVLAGVADRAELVRTGERVTLAIDPVEPAEGLSGLHARLRFRNTPARPGARLPDRLPDRILLPNALKDAARDARFAELRCRGARCALTGLLDEEEKPIH